MSAGTLAAVRAGRTVAVVLFAVQLVLWGIEFTAAGRPGASAAGARLRLDPNRARPAELMLLPRVGPQLAAAIVAHREAAAAQPAFRCVDDLCDVPRIGPALVNLLRPHVAIGAGLQRAAGSDPP